MGMDPATALLLGTVAKVGGGIYSKNQQAKQQGKLLRNKMDTLEEYGIHPLQAAGMGGGSLSGAGGSNIGSMVSSALQGPQAIKDKQRAQRLEDERFDLYSRHIESQILTQQAVAEKTQAETKQLEEKRLNPFMGGGHAADEKLLDHLTSRKSRPEKTTYNSREKRLAARAKNLENFKQYMRHRAPIPRRN